MSSAIEQSGDARELFDDGCSAIEMGDYSSARDNFDKFMEIIRDDRNYYIVPNLNNIILEIINAIPIMEENYDESKELIDFLYQFMIDYLGATSFTDKLIEIGNELDTLEERSSTIGWEEKKLALINIRSALEVIKYNDFPPYGA